MVSPTVGVCCHPHQTPSYRQWAFACCDRPPPLRVRAFAALSPAVTYASSSLRICGSRHPGEPLDWPALSVSLNMASDGRAPQRPTAEPSGRTSRSAASAHATATTRSRRRIVRGPTGAASPPRRLRPQVDSPPIEVEFSPARIAVAGQALLLEVHSAGSTMPWQPSCDKQQWAASPAESCRRTRPGFMRGQCANLSNAPNC